MNKEIPALEISELTVNYERAAALWNISLKVPQGKLVAIIGPNGAGKSTLIKAALGLIKPLSGCVSFFGKSLNQVRKRVAYVPQRESVDWDFPITVFDLVLMGRYGKIGLFKRITKEDKEAVRKYLEMVGLENYSQRQISQLSGGQQQRAFLARALIQESDLYFMDEPFTGIDITSTNVILDILKQLKESGKSVFIVHHDLESVSQTFDWAILLNMRLVAQGDVQSVLTPQHIHCAYGKECFLWDEARKLNRGKSAGF